MAVTPNVENDDTISLILEPRVDRVLKGLRSNTLFPVLRSRRRHRGYRAGRLLPGGLLDPASWLTEVTIFDGADGGDGRY